MGIKYRKLKFGESCVFDYYKHGRHLKRKMNEHSKEIGLHLPRSDLQVKLNDYNLNTMTKINVNELEVSFLVELIILKYIMLLYTTIECLNVNRIIKTNQNLTEDDIMVINHNIILNENISSQYDTY